MASFSFKCEDEKLSRGIIKCYNKWSSGTVHEKRRAKLLVEYVNYLGSPFATRNFESIQNVKKFIEQHKNKTKWLMTGTFTQIINECMNGGNLLFSEPRLQIDCKKMIDFDDFRFEKKSASSVTKKISNADVEKFILHHNQCGHSIDACAAVIQIVGAFRFAEVSMFGTEKVDVEVQVCDCDQLGFCEFVKNSCFLKVKVEDTKTGKITKNLLPCVLNCVNFIAAANTNLNYTKYSKFIKNINSELSPHCLRSFLPNLCSSARFNNTWANQHVFKKHYLLSETQLFDLAIFFKEFKIHSL